MIQHKIAIVTGGGKGIGRAIATSLAKENATVVLAARTLAELEHGVQEIEHNGGKALAVRCDVTNEQDVKNLVEHTIKTFGTIDILINNAGIGRFYTVVDFPVEQFDEMFAVNMRGVFLCTKYVLPTMMKHQRGAIINIASLAGKNSFAGGAGYSATKHALLGFAKSLMLEVRQHNIKVSTICPGSVDTEFSSPSHHEKKSGILLANDVAQVVVDVLKMPLNALVSEVDIRPTNPK